MPRSSSPFPGQRIPTELQIEFELLRQTEKEPALLRDWVARLQRRLASAARPAPWSILQVDPCAERKVAAALGPKTEETPHGAGLTVYVPLEKYRPKRTWKSRTRPLIPGYILALLRTDEELDTARAHPAVRKIMCRDGVPLKVPAICIGSLILFEACGEFDQTWNSVPERDKSRGRRPTRRAWEKGEVAKVVEGPFASFPAEIVNAERADRIEVMVMIFGRATPVQLDEEMLEAVA
jgi:transcription antitermination factor NusG